MPTQAPRQSSAQESQWVSAATLANRYEVSQKTIWGWAKSGRIPPAVKIGPNITRWKLSEVIAAVEIEQV
jgi:prophage regulatory protein